MKKMSYKIILLTMVLFIVSGCVRPTGEGYNKNVSAMNDLLKDHSSDKRRVQDDAKSLTLPPAVIAKMMPSSTDIPGQKDSASLVRFDVAVNNVDAKEFFSGLSQGANTSVILSPGVTGSISLELKQVTLVQVLDAVCKLYGYHYEKTNYGYTIYPKELQTRIFMIDRLSLQRTLKTNSHLNSSSGDLTQSSSASSSSGDSSSGAVTNPSTVTIEASRTDTFWTDIQSTLAALIGADGDGKSAKSDAPMVQANAETGMIVVRAYPQEIGFVEQYLAKTQNILGRQVIIEAEILDVTLSAEYSSGIDWTALTAGGATSNATAQSPSEGILSNIYTLSMSGDSNNFTYALNLLSTQGRISVLSKPRVSTMNNQSAIIKIGSDNYYVTSVESQVTTGGDTSSNTTTSTINLQAYFSGIALYVTPQITEDGDVNLHIHPSISKVTENTLNVTVDNQESVLPVAQSQIRETDTMVRAKDGQVVILGGLMQTGESLSSSGLPFSPKYNDTLGAVTTSKENVGLKSELVILLRPIVVHDGVWQSELGKIAKTAYTKKSEKEFFANELGN